MTTHTVKSGETLSSIAHRHGTSVHSLQKLNGIRDPNGIGSGRVLVTAPPPAPHLARKAAAAGQVLANSAPKQLPSTILTPCPAANKPLFKKRAGGDDNVDVLYVVADGKAKRKGILGDAKVEVGMGLLKMSHAGKFGNSYFGGSHKLESMTAEAKAEGGIVAGLGGKASAKALMKSQEASLFVGKDNNNPWAEAGGEYNLLQAEAKVDALLGSDGRRVGIVLGAKAEAAAATGDLKGEVNVPIPWTNWILSIKGKAGVKAGAVGAGAGAYGFKDIASGRYHTGAWGVAAALVGINGVLDLSAGPRYDSRERSNGP